MSIGTIPGTPDTDPGSYSGQMMQVGIGANPSASRGPAWAGLLILGIFMIVAGIIQVAMASSFSSNSNSGFGGFDTGFESTMTTIGGVLILVGFIMIVLSFFVHKHEDYEEVARLETVEEQRKEQIEEIAKSIKDQMTVKVRCRYCGSLNDENANKCESCGAAL
jgi:uncharacterized membrane protein